MKVRELIEMLQDADGEHEVLAFDADADEFVPVSGMVYGVGDEVVLQTDDEGFVEISDGATTPSRTGGDGD